MSNVCFLKILASCFKIWLAFKSALKLGFVNVKGCDNEIGGLVILNKGHENIEIVKLVFGKKCGYLNIEKKGK